jgi:hypothetical protein
MTRKFGLLDGMIVIGALGVLFALERRFVLLAIWSIRNTIQNLRVGGIEFVSVSREFFGALAPPILGLIFVAGVTLATLELRPPRQSFRRLTRRPGFVACLVASVVSVVQICKHEFLFQLKDRCEFTLWDFLLSEETWAEVGYAVLGAWILLASSGRWRSNGRISEKIEFALGIIWIASPLWKVIEEIEDFFK